MLILKTIKILLSFFILFSFTEKMYPQYTIYTPEGRSVNAMVLDGTPYYDNAWAQYWIAYFSLDAEIISGPTRAYNCHGYAWAATEGIGNYWIQDNGELNFFSDAAYSNDGQPSYISVSEGSATHGCYEPYSDHSIRVIQNSYPVSSSGSKTQVSKWNDGPLVRHGLRGDVYAAFYAANNNNNPVPIDFRTLKTNHYGTLSNYPKTWIGAGGKTHTLTNNVTVPSGFTLALKPSVNLNFNNKYILVNGTVSGADNIICTYLKQGSTLKGLFGTIQSAVNYASSGLTVELQSRSYSESLSFSSKSNIILRGQGTGSTILNNPISVTNSSNIDIVELRLNNTITINSSSYTNIGDCNIQGSTMVNDYGGTQTNLGYSSGTYATANFAYNSYGGTGDIYYTEITDHDVAVYLVNYASYNVGDHDYFCGNLLDIYAGSGAYAYAISNTYSYSGAVQGNVFVTGTNHVCGGLAKSSEPSAFNESNLNNDFKNADEKYLWLLRMISEDKRNNNFDLNKHLSYFNELIKEYKDVLKVKREKFSVKNSLSKLFHLYKAINQTVEFDSFINTLINTEKNESLMPYIERHKVWSYVDKEDYDGSIELADKIISVVDEEDLICEMKYEKGLVYKYYLQNESEANRAFAELIADHPEHLLSKYAVNEITAEQIEISTRIKDDADGYSISAYPNPFNPTTQISYSIPEKGFVSVKVFDILGREVAKLVDEVRDAGKYTVTFDGSRISSGIYIYSISSGKFSESKKMLMVK